MTKIIEASTQGGFDKVNLDADSSEERGTQTLVGHDDLLQATRQVVKQRGRHVEVNGPIRFAGFQLEAQTAMDRHFGQQRGGRGILVLPTGAGKTIVTVTWTLSRYIGRGLRVLWVTHRVDLLEQVYDVITEQVDGLPIEVSVSRYDADNADLSGNFILATVQTLASRRPSLAQMQRHGRLGLVVFDEVHHSVAPTWWAALKRMVRSRRVDLLGLTATPFRSTDAETAELRRIYGDTPIYQKTFRDLIAIGFLARPVLVNQQIASTQGFEVTEEEVNRARRLGDLPPDVLSRLAQDAGRTAEIVAYWDSERETYGKTLVFACNIQHAEALAAAFQQRGVTAAALHSNLPQETRRERLATFRSGDCEVLVNVGILTEGADVPDIRTVLMARPTMSKVLYIQMIGRGARGPHTAQGKTQFYVIDCVDAFHRHGLIMVSGRDLAEELGATPHAAREARPRRSAIIRTLAWMHLRGFAAEQYTLWGELRWTRGDGSQQSMVVFLETLESIETALEHVLAGINSGDWRGAESQATYLADLGAARIADWNTMVGDARKTKIPPELIAIEAAEERDEDEALVVDLAEFVDDLALLKGYEAIQHCEREWNERPEWQAMFPNWVALWQHVASLFLAIPLCGSATLTEDANSSDAA